jgi:hypothetical protein
MYKGFGSHGNMLDIDNVGENVDILLQILKSIF